MDVFEALKVIKNTCESNVKCEMCELRNHNGRCAVIDSDPSDWSLVDKNPVYVKPSLFK